ncbi:MAG: DUF134 domain-containing protein [Archaeoglobus sp.]|nr:DUF134 domain-containing protein [Archaeoglobus sp.]
MPRRKKRRWVFLDLYERGVGGNVEISFDELEALRLADIEGFNQNEAAKLMGISQPTFHRILKEARRKAGLTILYGMGYKLKGGDHIMRRFKCYDCGYEWEEPFGTGRPETCPKCGSANIHRMDPGRGRGKGGRGGRGGSGRGSGGAGRAGKGAGRGMGRG